MLNHLWQELQRAESHGAPENCTGLIEVPFLLDTVWYSREYMILARQWFKPDVIEPFADITKILGDLPSARIHHHHLACCAIPVAGAENSALNIRYALGDIQHCVALPGITYALRNP